MAKNRILPSGCKNSIVTFITDVVIAKIRTITWFSITRVIADVHLLT